MNHEEYRAKVIELQKRIGRLEERIVFYINENERLKKLIPKRRTNKTAVRPLNTSTDDGTDFQEDYTKFQGGIWTET